MSDLPLDGKVCIASLYSASFICYPLKFARTSLEMKIGMMHATSMNYALAFEYQDEEIRSFWMKNVLFPLDIVFVRRGVIQEIVHSASECIYPDQIVCPSYVSKLACDLVIEFPGGWCKHHQVSEGDRVRLI